MTAPGKTRSGKELIRASTAFASENRALSWWYLASTLAIFAGLLAVAAMAPFWPLRFAAGVVEGLVFVRLFILYHDFLHGAILKGSPLAKAVMYGYGAVSLNPPRVWRETHNYHHANTAKIVGSHVGSYAMVTPDLWRRMSKRERLLYRLQRHPLTMLFGYASIFIYGMCLSSLIRNPRRHWSSALALLVHVSLLFAVIAFAGIDVFFFAMFLPQFVASALGAYLFYAQHNFPGIHIQPREHWSYTRAALESSSYMKLGPIMNWFTGNIGYHHVHHLNPRIPFYRLPEAMAAIPELQTPRMTRLRLKDIRACFSLKLWDPAKQCMVGYPAD